jgi:predicted phosphodiesterase
LRYRKPGAPDFKTGPEYHFHTARTPGSPFVFEIQGDSHPERSPKQNVPELYEQTLLAVAKDRPDFFICMGDDFSVDTLQEINKTTVEGSYLRQLPYLGLLAHSTPLFLVNGNHEQASRANHDGKPDNVAVWAQNARNSLFPQPAPDGFYSGDKEEVPHIGLLRDYYAWTWGDALFVTIDPYWHSKVAVDNKFGGGDKRRDLWEIGLGEEQYRWLKQTLEVSQAKYKFVFAHHVNGTGRGGVAQAGYYEWGGKSRDGRTEFKTKRPGWAMPVHQLMAKNGVTIFFQGHDHIFAREELDGVVYQTLPDPANLNPEPINAGAYPGADIFPNSGRVRVAVGPENVRVEYVSSRLPSDATAEHPDGEIIFAYEVSLK